MPHARSRRRRNRPVRTALALRLHESGLDVIVGSRDAERAQRRPLEFGCVGETNGDACRDADFIVLAVNAEAALDTVRELRAAIGETPAALGRVGASLLEGRRAPRDGAQSPRRAHPSGARWPGPRGIALVGRVDLGAEHPPEEDAFVCGDDFDAKALGLDLADRLTSGRALDAGPLASARALEGLTAVIVNLNKRYKGHAGIRVTGLP